MFLYSSTKVRKISTYFDVLKLYAIREQFTDKML